MAKNVEIKTVAQQVEDFNIYEWLQDIDVDFVQGYVLHEPLAIETLIYH